MRVVTYNVLSSSLADPWHFPSCKPEFLDKDYRYGKLLEVLEEEVKEGSIICLQEVSQLWYGKLQAFFTARGYVFNARLYGGAFNDYMGVGIAAPLSTYEVTGVHTERVGDMLHMPREPRPSVLVKHWRTVMHDAVYCPLVVALVAWLVYFGPWSWYKAPLEPIHILGWLIFLLVFKLYNTGRLAPLLRVLRLAPASNFDIWWESKKRYNNIVAFVLTTKKGGKSFLVSTYHMPCKFQFPDFMVVHSALALQWVQRIAKEYAVPYVLLGDFNWKPPDAAYQLYSTGTVEPSHPHFPKRPEGMKWTIDVDPVRSAYLEVLGQEPDFTNNAHVKGCAPFIETLDYIWVSEEWLIRDVRPLPPRATAVESGPFPAEHEPSDHVLLWANLSI